MLKECIQKLFVNIYLFLFQHNNMSVKQDLFQRIESLFILDVTNAREQSSILTVFGGK